MSDSILKRYATVRPQADEPHVSTGGDSDEVENLGFFGWLRGVRDRSVMLEFRKKDGGIVAFDYALLRKVEHDPSQGITLHFGGEAVKIMGRNLKNDVKGVSLVRGLLWHRVPWIREAGDAEILKTGDSSTVIESIKT